MGSEKVFLAGRGRTLALVFALALAGIAGRARAEEAWSCGLSEARGVSADDAAGALDLLCDHLRRESGGRGAYEVSLGTLGRTVVVTVSRRDTAESITVRIDGIEEIATAGARIAEALVHGRPFAATQRVDNLLEDETRTPLSKKGSGVKFTLGVADLESIGHGARGAAFSLGLTYASPRFSLPAEVRFGWSDDEYPGPHMELFSVSIGGRGFLTRRNWSPFVGGGMGVLRLEVGEGEYPDPGRPGGYFYADRFGVAPYVEAGVEGLRLHRARLVLSVRADLPTAALRSDEIPIWDPRTGETNGVLPAQSRYVVPVTIGLSVAF